MPQLERTVFDHMSWLALSCSRTLLDGLALFLLRLGSPCIGPRCSGRLLPEDGPGGTPTRDVEAPGCPPLGGWPCMLPACECRSVSEQACVRTGQTWEKHGPSGITARTSRFAAHAAAAAVLTLRRALRALLPALCRHNSCHCSRCLAPWAAACAGVVAAGCRPRGSVCTATGRGLSAATRATCAAAGVRVRGLPRMPACMLPHVPTCRAPRLTPQAGVATG